MNNVACALIDTNGIRYRRYCGSNDRSRRRSRMVRVQWRQFVGAPRIVGGRIDRQTVLQDPPQFVCRPRTVIRRIQVAIERAHRICAHVQSIGEIAEITWRTITPLRTRKCQQRTCRQRRVSLAARGPKLRQQRRTVGDG